MSCFLERRWGGAEENPSVEDMRSALAELEINDGEHSDTWLQHESGWTLAAHENGLLVWENLESTEAPRHMTGVARNKVLDLWVKLAQGRVHEIHREQWLLGTGTRPSQAVIDEAAATMRALDREYYNRLGPERAEVPCQREGCSRGAVRFSVLCRSHHFENVKQRICPFED
jgi:hypothetical protein